MVEHASAHIHMADLLHGEGHEKRHHCSIGRRWAVGNAAAGTVVYIVCARRDHLEAQKLVADHKALWCVVEREGAFAAYLLVQANAGALGNIEEQQGCALVDKLLGKVLIKGDGVGGGWGWHAAPRDDDDGRVGQCNAELLLV